MIDQNVFFEGLNFEEFEFEYETGKRKCFKGADGAFYRVDFFGKAYVIECAENEEDAKMNLFEDADTYDGSMPKDDVVKQIRSDLKDYVK